ncbi:hypothetical protein [Spongiibacter sp.]|uniref:hypothetical protein n=1 Tax=Spongiibacter sp. TaxID=2024860 RepID=UPI00356B42A5
MKDLLLVISVLLCSGPTQAGCSAWEKLGGVLPARVDGDRASYQQMADAEQRTRRYIHELEATIAHCKPDDVQYNTLVDGMERAALRYNRQLRIYRQRHGTASVNLRQ